MADDEDATTSEPTRPRWADAAPRASYETGESSASAAATLLGGSGSLAPAPIDDAVGGPAATLDVGSYARENARLGRQHKHRSSGAFILQDAFDDAAADGDHNHRRKPYRHSLQPAARPKASPRGAVDMSRTGGSRHVGLGIDSSPAAKASVSPEPSSRPMSSITVSKRQSANGNAVPSTKAPKLLETTPSPPRAGDQALDMDSAQIVNMALNLSESRRLASRRNASQPAPPRLAPLPDTSVGGSLRQHLQQQRRVSRTGSPRPDRGPGARITPGHRVNSGLQGLPDSLHEQSYRYHFTPSTLARAQKAKEQLELMAQYRRLLELVPPMKPSFQLRSAASSPPSSPVAFDKVPTFGSADSVVRLGRAYNPLQYIRNRKVRARERKAIDGEEQGFSDVLKVTDWVDQTARWAATGQSAASGGISLPPYADADAAAEQASSAPAVRPKRPRVDWFVEPASLIADAYWLEKDQNKLLIEDRHWRRIFPQTAELYQPLGRQTTQEPPLNSPQRPQRPDSEAPDTDEEEASRVPALTKADTDHSHSSARERARQKLHDLKGGFHHRHNSSVHSHHEFLRHRHGSISDVSDSDNEAKDRRVRSGTITSNSKDLLEKQMMEMIAREAREAELQQPSRGPRSLPPMTPERYRESTKPRPLLHSRQGSVVDASESDEKSAREPKSSATVHRHRPGRESLDVPRKLPRASADVGDSSPNSPDLRPIRTSGLLPAIGMDLTPPTSRPGSPTRKTLTKVKHIFRDRSRERGGDVPSEEKVESVDFVHERDRALSVGPETSLERLASLDRQESFGTSTSKLQARGTGESQKSHRSVGSLRLRGDEQGGGGVRGLFKGARIDTVIRGGVSKLGDLIWRREAGGSADALSEGTTTDDSGDELGRGRRGRNSAMVSRAASSRRAATAAREERRSSKHFLDVMPTFQSTLEANGEGKLPGGEDTSEGPDSGSSPRSSRRPTRFDMLKPPRIDVRNPSPSSSPPVTDTTGRRRPRPVGSGSRVPSGSEFSDSDSLSRPGSYIDGVRAADARLSTIISMPPSFRSTGAASSSSQRERPWSLSDRRASSTGAGGGGSSGPTISRREVARLRALILSSGVLAMEIARRAHEPRRVFAGDAHPAGGSGAGSVSWPEIAALSTDPAALAARPVAAAQLYPLAARALGGAIQASAVAWQGHADEFSRETAPRLERRVDGARARVAVDLTGLARAAADEADETSRDLALSQRLKIKRVVDVIEKMLRRRRRRFRWVRRAMWLAVEWVLVGIMWYVWFVVMIFRVVLGVGQGVGRAVRWLLWL